MSAATFLFRQIDDPGQVVGLSLRSGEVELPRLVLRKGALDHNIDAMKRYCQAHDVWIAPHVKTTMAPAIIQLQLAAGAWGVTVATLSQLRTCLRLGAKRILLANELIDPNAACWLGSVLSTSADQEVYCLVDSVPGVERLARGWKASGNPAPIPVLVEVGVPGGRAGCRSPAEAFGVAVATNDYPEVSLRGVEGFEGILGTGRTPDEIARVDRFLETIVASAQRLVDEALFADQPEVLLSAGGSKYFDRVTEIFGAADLGVPHRVVLRSGCYVTHDHAPPDSTPTLDGVRLEAALELWADVLSVPEPGRAIAGFGRRDAPFDVGLPVALGRFPASGGEFEPVSGVEVSTLNDQHAYLDVGSGATLAVGDRMVFGIRHPCTAFDKWRQVLLVDDDHRVRELVDTAF